MPNDLTAEVSGRVRLRVRKLRLDMSALHHLEKVTQEKAFEAIDKMDGSAASFVTLRHLIQGAMRAYHPDATLAEAQAFIAKHPEKIRDLLKRAFPDAEADGDGGGDAPGKPKGAKG